MCVPRCAGFLVQKSELELQRSDVELCQSDLQQALFLLESGTGEPLLHVSLLLPFEQRIRCTSNDQPRLLALLSRGSCLLLLSGLLFTRALLSKTLWASQGHGAGKCV